MQKARLFVFTSMLCLIVVTVWGKDGNRQSAISNRLKAKATAKVSTSCSSIALLFEPDSIAILKSRAEYYSS